MVGVPPNDSQGAIFADSVYSYRVGQSQRVNPIQFVVPKCDQPILRIRRKVRNCQIMIVSSMGSASSSRLDGCPSHALIITEML